MQSILKRAGLALVAILIIIQFIHPSRNNNAAMSGNDISTVTQVPDEVNTLLHRACYDCHSNSTNYPWYSHVQPIDWWLNDHIVDGKRHLNFSEFATYKPMRKFKKMSEIAEEVEKGDMPLQAYTLIHKEAKFTDNEKQQVIAWATNAAKDLYTKVSPEDIAADKKREEEKK